MVTTRADIAQNNNSKWLMTFATIGLTALIDEATGYHDVRDKHALQSMLPKGRGVESLQDTSPDRRGKETFHTSKIGERG